MIVTIVEVNVKPECVEQFIQETLKNHNGAIKEPGNIRFDVLQSSDDPTQFSLYEVYDSPEDVVIHKETEHYLSWRKNVADMMAKPRSGKKHKVIAPTDMSLWK